MSNFYLELLEEKWLSLGEGPHTNDAKLKSVIAESKWPKCRFQRARVSPFVEMRYVCACSQPLNRYFIVDDGDGNEYVIGSECISKILKGPNLVEARREMKKKEQESGERAMVRQRPNFTI